MRYLLESIGIEFPFLILWLGVLYLLNTRGRERRAQRVMFRMVLAGGVSTAVVALLYRLNPLGSESDLGAFGYHFFVVGLTEEFVKFFTFIIMARALRSIREPQDGVIQGAAVGVGFTMVENVLYGVWYHPLTTMVRSFAIGFHALSGALWGFFWAAAVFENAGSQNTRAYMRALYAVFLMAAVHGLNNTLIVTAGSYEGALLSLYVLETVLLIIALRAFKWMKTRSPYYRFAYRDAGDAIDVIRAGLHRNPEDRTLRRRLAIYQIAAGSYEEAARGIRKLVWEGKTRHELRAFLGVALMGSHRSDEGRYMLLDAAGKLSPMRRRALERELDRVICDPRLRRAVKRELNSPLRGLDDWAARREYLRQWHAPRVVYPGPRR